MSVNYSARIGYGYIVTPSMLSMLYERGGEDLLNEFQESEWAFAANAWEPDTSFYFFGIRQGYADPGEIIPVPTRRTYKYEEFREMVKEFRRFFPNQEDYICRDWLISCVD